MGENLLRQFVFLLHSLTDTLLELFFGWFWGERKVCPQLNENEFLMKSAVDLAEMIRQKKLTSYQLVKAYIDRIKEVRSCITIDCFALMMTFQCIL